MKAKGRQARGQHLCRWNCRPAVLSAGPLRSTCRAILASRPAPDSESVDPQEPLGRSAQRRRHCENQKKSQCGNQGKGAKGRERKRVMGVRWGREGWSCTAVEGLQARQQEPRPGLPPPCSVSPLERVSWRGPFPPLLGWCRQQRLCTAPVTLCGCAPSLWNKDRCNHLPSLFSLGLLCVSLQARGVPLCQVGSPELELLLCGGAQSGPSPLPRQGLELGSTMWASYFTKTATPPLLGLEAKMREILPMSHIW